MFNTNDTTIICIDIQEKLVSAVKKEKTKQNAVKIMKAAEILNVDTIITEQYPKGLGETIKEIKSIKAFKTIEKTTFSAYQTLEFKEHFDKLNNKNVIVFGIETHICVLQTALDLIKKNYNVYLLSDCSASRDDYNHFSALNLLQDKGANILTLEIALFEFLKSSKHPNFKEIQSLIK